MKIMNTRLCRYPCVLCGELIVSRNGMLAKYCDNCRDEVCRFYARVYARRKRGWSEDRVFEGEDEKFIRVVYNGVKR